MKKVIILISSLVILFIFYAYNIYCFLAPHNSVDADVLVVEGWIPSELLEQAAILINQSSYKVVVALGGPIGDNKPTKPEDSYALRCRKELIQFGVADDLIYTVAAGYVEHNRTRAAAQSFRAWLTELNMPIDKLDLITASVHGRKSRLIFQRVLGEDIQVGIISVHSGNYGTGRWLGSPYMIYRVLRNTIGYLYALFFVY